MKRPRSHCSRSGILILVALLAGTQALAQTVHDSTGEAPFAHSAAGSLSGELMAWHRITLGFEGPSTSETADPNPFTDYRLDVTFSNGSKTYVVPGYYAADGNAANTGSDSGNVWLVHFCPDAPGSWKWAASFIKGSGVAQGAEGSSAGFFDGVSGAFQIRPSDKKGPDLRAKGRLEYIGNRYLRFAGTGEYFLKVGADSPENFLAYAEFDGSFKNDGEKDELVKTWGPHIQDWTAGDPTWAGGNGKGIIGAINYLSSKGMNSLSFLTMNIAGDDRNVFPYRDYYERARMDVSRLAQWEVVFEHAAAKGLHLHFKTQETENDQLLDGGGLGMHRRLYYRELIARFGHHPAITWNLGEETSNTTAQIQAFARFFSQHDPYRHHIVLHTFPGEQETRYGPLLGDRSELTGVSLQVPKTEVHKTTLRWVQASEAAGRPWVVANDEQNSADEGVKPDTDDPDHNQVRQEVLWGNLMAGGSGVEYYFGYKYANSDLTCQDWRSREKMWEQSRHALDFFRANAIPFWEMKTADSLTGDPDDYCLAGPGAYWVLYKKNGQSTNLDLRGITGDFTVRWYDPRNGGALRSGSIETLKGGAERAVGMAPEHLDKDWVVLVRASPGQ